MIKVELSEEQAAAIYTALDIARAMSLEFNAGNCGPLPGAMHTLLAQCREQNFDLVAYAERRAEKDE